MSKLVSRYALYFLFALVLFVLAACQSTPEGPAIVIDNAWGRPSPQVATNGAFYLTLENRGSQADTLLGGTSPACGVLEMHESYKTAQGMMGMRPVEGGIIEIAAGEQVDLKVGGLHFMCIDKLADFEAGAVLPLTLVFEKSGSVDVDVEIREP